MKNSLTFGKLLILYNLNNRINFEHIVISIINNDLDYKN